MAAVCVPMTSVAALRGSRTRPSARARSGCTVAWSPHRDSSQQSSETATLRATHNLATITYEHLGKHAEAAAPRALHCPEAGSAK